LTLLFYTLSLHDALPIWNIALGGGIKAVSSLSRAAAHWRCWRYSSVMKTVQIRNVPADIHAILRTRAAAAGVSLQEYLLRHLIEDRKSTRLNSSHVSSAY